MFDSLKQGTIKTRVIVKECLVEEYSSFFNLDLDSWVFCGPCSFEATSQLDGWLCRLLIEVSDWELFYRTFLLFDDSTDPIAFA